MELYNKKKDQHYVGSQTGSANCSRHHKRKKNDKLVEFAGQTTFPITSNPTQNQMPLSVTPFTVASVTLEDVRAGNIVWLNGLFHVNNNGGVPRVILTRIYKNTVVPGNLIYQSVI